MPQRIASQGSVKYAAAAFCTFSALFFLRRKRMGYIKYEKIALDGPNVVLTWKTTSSADIQAFGIVRMKDGKQLEVTALNKQDFNKSGNQKVTVPLHDSTEYKIIAFGKNMETLTTRTLFLPVD